MPKHTFEETTNVGNKVFFAGEVELSEADAKLLGKASSETAVTITGAFPEDYPGYDVLGQVEGMTPEKLAGMPDKDILDIKGIGPETLKAIRAYKK